MKKIILVLILFMGLLSCTKNGKVKTFGGTETFTLESNQKLVNLTWKNTDLWILTRTMKEGETPETYNFTEKSSFGILQGKFIIVETK